MHEDFSLPFYKLKNPIKPYAWGSLTDLASFLGRPPAADREAELWIGTHPLGPSALEGFNHEDGSPVLLSEILDSELPYLLKVLAIETPLSIQIHPSKHEAEAGFLRENSAKIPLDDPLRIYKDNRAKPEMIVALSPLVLFQGFREASEILKDFKLLDASALKGISFSNARVSDQQKQKIQILFSHLLSLPKEQKQQAINLALEKFPREEEKGHWIFYLSQTYPDDVMALAPLFFNLVRLEPGQGLFTPANIPHAYLSGMGVEIMGDSDNVLRLGLTKKPTCVEEFLAYVSFESRRPSLVVKEEHLPRLIYKTPSQEKTFGLSKIVVGNLGRAFIEVEPRTIFLCVEGSVSFLFEDFEISLRQGESLFAPFLLPLCELRGSGVLFEAFTHL